MKTVNIIIVAIMSIVLGSNSYAQTHDHSKMDMASTKTENIKVWGNCESCEARIEKAAKVNGLTNAKWN